MMPTDRFERRLPGLLTELAEPRTPDYLDDLLWQTAHTSQRPAWSILERWLPMVDIARQPVLAPRIPWRSIGLALALLGLLLAAVAIVLVGTQPRLPDPFGVARNGLLAYSANGDIFAGDSITGVSTAIVSGPETDLGPRYSLDGTHIVFERKVEGSSGPGQLFVTGSNGGDLTLVTPEAPFGMAAYQFSPDGSEIMFTSLVKGISTISVARSDGSGVRTLDVGFAVTPPDYRPPGGTEIVFGGQPDGRISGLYAVRPDGSGLRTIVEPAGLVFDHVRWSPDGSEIAYSAWGVNLGPGEQARGHVTSADGQTTRILPSLPETELEGRPIWSNDGSQLLIIRCNNPPDGGNCVYKFGVIPADGRDVGIQLETDVLSFDDSSETQLWSPDDRSILAGVLDAQGTAVSGLIQWDPLTGRTEPVPWNPSGEPSWQRLAP